MNPDDVANAVRHAIEPALNHLREKEARIDALVEKLEPIGDELVELAAHASAPPTVFGDAIAAGLRGARWTLDGKDVVLLLGSHLQIGDGLHDAPEYVVQGSSLSELPQQTNRDREYVLKFGPGQVQALADGIRQALVNVDSNITHNDSSVSPGAATPDGDSVEGPATRTETGSPRPGNVGPGSRCPCGCGSEVGEP